MITCFRRRNIPTIFSKHRFIHVFQPHNYVELLDRCIEHRSLRHGKAIHQYLIMNNNHLHCFESLDKLTRLYVTCGRLYNARQVFDEIPRPNAVLWDLMIHGYAWNGPFYASVELYGKMVSFGVVPSKFTYPFVLKACAGLSCVRRGEAVHCHVIRRGFEGDVYVGTGLVDFYAKCGELRRAEDVFWKMDCKDIVAWNAMIAGVSVHGFYDDVARLVVDMQKVGVQVNSSTVVTVLPAVAQARKLCYGKAIHAYSVRQGFSNAVMVGTGLLDMYGKCGCVSYARTVFELLDVKNEVTWSAMIGAFVVCDHMKDALELFNRMLVEDDGSLSPVTLGSALGACTKLTDLSNGRRIHGRIIKSGHLSDLMVSNTALSMYAKCGETEDAIKYFREMDPIDRVSYGAMISGCVQNGNSQQALNFFRKMQFSGIEPEEATMLALIPACSHLSALKFGACAHGYCVTNGFVTDTSICNALIDMYAKCGRVKTSKEVFNWIHKRDIISWNSMISTYGTHGLGLEALCVFEELKKVGLKPDGITFISLLIACSHSGLVAEGKHCFDAMAKEFQVVPRIDHYICMVDLLGRAGLLEEALSFIKKMPCSPNVHVWSALLAACKIHKNVDLAEEASKRIQSLGPESSGNFVLLSNIYSNAGRWEDAASVRNKQRGQGFRKWPGCSWVEINGINHTFIRGDDSHPQSDQIYKKLEELVKEMKRRGYQTEHNVAFQDVEDEEKEHILLHHSEKIAIAFAIINLSPSEPIFVTKNLRVCSDCHEAIKYITLISKREITVRDTSRFHHFKNGVCNCRNFW